MPTPPGDPDYFDKVNYVIDSWARPCEAPWYIYVETLKPALLTAFITLITFGWDDVARGYFRPRGLGRRSSKKRGKRGRKPFIHFPELGEEIGKRLPGAEEIKGEKWSILGKTMWRIDTVVQRFLFYWLVADVTIDFAYDWTSLLYETHWCKASAKGRFSYRVDGLQTMLGQDWSFAALTVKEYETPEPDWTGKVGGTGPNGAFIACALNFEPILVDPIPTSYQMRIIDWPSRAVLAETGPINTDDDDNAKGLVQCNIGHAGQFRVQVKQNGVAAFYKDGFVTGMEN